MRLPARLRVRLPQHHQSRHGPATRRQLTSTNAFSAACRKFGYGLLSTSRMNIEEWKYSQNDQEAYYELEPLDFIGQRN